jgi:hypothetical protein
MSATEKELADLEKQIEAKVEEQAKAAPAETPSPDPEPEPSPASTEETSAPAAASSEPPKDEFNASEWVKKKGWKTPEDAAQSLHALEKAFHEKSQEVQKLKEGQAPAPYGYQPYQPPPQGYPPQMPQQGYFPPPPAYAPPPNPWAPPSSRLSEEQLAMSYGFTVEDFRRVLALSKDMAEVQARQVSQEFERWKSEVEKTNEKNSDLTSVMADPAFHSESVQYEMHELFQKNPQLWTERRPYTTALSRALTNIGRRNLGAGATRPAGMSLPSAPPQTAGANSSSGTLPGKRIGALPTPQEQEKMSAAELEKILKRNGAVKTYADM